MRTVFDQCAKQLAREALEGWGHLETQREVLPEVQAIDIAFEPSGAPLPPSLGVLGQMAESACMLEPYSEAPNEHDLGDCVLRQLAWHRERLRKVAAEERAALARPWLWVLSAQPLKKMLGRFGFASPQAQEAWPAGFYLLAPAHRVGLVLLPDLPRLPETLLLRMMGRGGTRAGAIEDAFALAEDDARRAMIAQLVMRLRIELPAELQQQEGLMSTQAASLYDQFISDLRQEGRVEGRTEGRMEGRMEGRKQDLRRILEKRFGAAQAWSGKLDACQSEAVLDELLDAAISADKLEDVLAVLARA